MFPQIHSFIPLYRCHVSVQSNEKGQRKGTNRSQDKIQAHRPIKVTQCEGRSRRSRKPRSKNFSASERNFSSTSATSHATDAQPIPRIQPHPTLPVQAHLGEAVGLSVGETTPASHQEHHHFKLTGTISQPLDHLQLS